MVLVKKKKSNMKGEGQLFNFNNCDFKGLIGFKIKTQA